MARILKFYADSYKRLKVVEFLPDENLVTISGKNGQGKSSVMDAVLSALSYKAGKLATPQPVRLGEDQATVILDIGEYVITRTFDPDGSSKLTIETQAGHLVKSPQGLLDSLVGKISLDPMEFSEANDADRREMLEEIFGLNLAEFEAKDAALKESRKDSKKELEMINGRLNALKPPGGDDPVKEASASELIDRLTKLSQAHNKFLQLESESAGISKQLVELSAKLENLVSQACSLDASFMHEGGLALGIGLTTALLQNEIANIESRNARAREVKDYLSLRDKHDTCKAGIDKLSKQIELVKIERAEAIENAKIPIPGLSVEEDGIRLNGIPFEQLAASERIRASMAIAMAANPELRVIRVMDGSLLDEDNIKVIADMARDRDFQLWIECVSSDTNIGIYIEDGAIKQINAPIEHSS